MEEKRKYKRIYFSSEEYIAARFTLAGNGGFFNATVLNMGEGGLGLLLNKLETARPSVGDLVVVDKIENRAGNLSALVGVRAKVVWVAQLDELQSISFGCEFLELLPSAREDLQLFCTDWEKQHL
jgi:c-di-GMP-binding flagellar brake protein YcgR